MTAILATPTVILADSQASWHNTRTTCPDKVRRIGNHLVGCAGGWVAEEQFFRWYAQSVEDPAVPNQVSADMEALLLHGDAILRWTDHTGILCVVHEPAWAIGSAQEILLGALWAGATLIKAMAIACTRGHGCDWPIRWYALDGWEGIVTQQDYTQQQYPQIVLEQPFVSKAPILCLNDRLPDLSRMRPGAVLPMAGE